MSPLNSMSGAVDLSALVNRPAPGAPSGSQSAGSVPGPFVIDVTAANLRAVLETSSQLPVIASFYSSASDPTLAVDTHMRALAAQYAGRFQLARVDTDISLDVAQAFGVTGLPAAVAILQGQPVPLFQGTPAEDELAPMVDRILQAAAQYGITGVLDGDEDAIPEEPPLPAHMAEAYEAMEEGDYDTAQAEFSAALRDNPANEAAKTGLVQAELVQRVTGLDRDAVLQRAKEAPLTDIATQLDAADIEVALGRPDAGFARLIDVIKSVSGKERDTVRERLLQLFDVVGTHEPLVTQARKALALALF